MLANNLKIALRTLFKFKGYAFINLFGLALGLTAGILIMIYVLDEISYDQFHVKKDRIYRVTTAFFQPETGEGGAMSTNAWPIGKILEKEFPEVEAVLYTRPSSLLISYEGKRIRQRIFYTSPEFLTMFSFPLIKGNPAKALNDPYAVVISQEMEKKYFHGESALNKSLVMADTLNFVVTGVMANMPSSSHIQADMIISFSTFMALTPGFGYQNGWGNINMTNYVLLKPGADFKNFSEKAKDIYTRRAGEMLKNWGVSARVRFESLNDIYLRSKSGNSYGSLGSIDRVYLLSGIALFVILLACINFINLATARSVYRAKEVGLRKVVGSSRMGLIRQFLSESFLLTFLSLLIALAMTGLFLPFFNELLGKNYQLLSMVQLSIVVGVIILVIIISFLSGYYPAWVISGLRPADVLKGKMQTSSRGVRLRRFLVVFQFVISVGLVMGTMVVIDQLDYMEKQALGFDKDEIIVINAARAHSPNPEGFESFENELKSLAHVNEVTFANALPGVPGWVGQVAYPEGKSGDDAISVEYMAVDENYIKTLGLTVIAGRGFDKQHESELKDGLVLNETAVHKFGWPSPENAIGKKITSPSGFPAGEVIGVVKDYHQLGLQQKIGPIAMDYAPKNSYLYAVGYKGADTKSLIGELNKLWQKHFQGYDFIYFFLDQDFERQYQAEQRLANVFALFAFITILIAIIGLVGLVSYIVVARTKEIGIRKILGADVFSVTRLLSTEFLILVLISNVIAIPFAWYFSNQWLEKFAYRMTLNPLLFFWTMLLAVTITLLVVSYQTIRAATADPVKSLRYE